VASYADRRDPGIGSLLRLILLIVELALVAVVLILGAAFLMSFFGANPEASFASWIYSRTDAIMTPFNGIFDPISVSTGTEINLSLLFAMLVYGVGAAVLASFARRL
jgi:uncharacterized protein YggT (Ycf19 family)